MNGGWVVTNGLRLRRIDPRRAERRVAKESNTTACVLGCEGDQPQKTYVMKKRFNVEGMMCDHCRAHVEKALNTVEGVKAVVTLSPAEAEVEFTRGEKSTEELQRAISQHAGDYRLSEK